MEAQTQKRRINQIFLSADHKRNTAPESIRTHHLALEDGRHIVDLRSTNEATIIEAEAGADFSQVPEMAESEAAEIATELKKAGEINSDECDRIQAELKYRTARRKRKPQFGFQPESGLWRIGRDTAKRLLRFSEKEQTALLWAAVSYIAESTPGEKLPEMQTQAATEMLRELITGEQAETTNGGE